jgi:hypothetical protein
MLPLLLLDEGILVFPNKLFELLEVVVVVAGFELPNKVLEPELVELLALPKKFVDG